MLCCGETREYDASSIRFAETEVIELSFLFFLDPFSLVTDRSPKAQSQSHLTEEKCEYRCCRQRDVARR